MKLFSSIILIIIFSNTVFAQDIEKAFKYIKEENFEKAEKIITKAQKNRKEVLATRYCLALMLNNPKYKKKNNLRAYRNFKYVYNKYPKAKNKEELKKRYNITQESAKGNMNEICRTAYEKLKNKGSTYELDLFIDVFRESDLAKIIERRRDSLVFNNIDKNDFRDYQRFMIKYPESDFTPKAERKFKELWKGMYESAAWYGEYRILKDFEMEYPNYPFFDAQSDVNIELARKADALKIPQGYKKENEGRYKAYIKTANSTEMAYLALLMLINPHLKKKDYITAVRILNEQKKHFKQHKKRIEDLINILSATDLSVKTTGISDKINTDGWEYAASVTADGEEVYFCGQNRKDNLVKGIEDVFKSILENNEWSEPFPVNSINTPGGNEAPLSISGDGSRMLLYSDGNIFYTDKTEFGWSKKRLFPKINDIMAWEADAMITADGNAIFFISDRKGNIGHYHEYLKDFHGRKSGNTDVYVSEKTKYGWSEPINIGSIINTPFTERSPFLHSDMKTLYFSSDGHAGLGSLDVFMCKRLSDTSWIQWSKPVNLGKEINTVAKESDYEISTDGKIAYFSSFVGGDFDIFYVELPKEIRPETVTTISGRILDKSGNHLYAIIKWENLETGELVGFSKSDPTTGKYIIILPNGKNYGYFVEKPDYYPVSGNVDLRKVEVTQKIKKDIILISEEDIVNNKVAVPLKNLFFEYNKHTIKRESYPELNRFAKFLKSNSKLEVEISGHTDNKGTDKYNKTLSKNRALEIKNYLVEKGCDFNKLIAKGYGKEKPVASNDTEEGRAANRRVEFKVIK